MRLMNTDILTLLTKVRDNGLKLICFGAGEQLHDACKLFDGFGFANSIHRIIDNNPKQFFYNGLSMKSYFPESVLDEAEDIIIYLSSKFYPQMYEQLDKHEELSGVECYVHDYVMHVPLPHEIPGNKNNKKEIIPKKIHYCWFGDNEIPKQNRIWMESWHKYCPDYEITRWDETNYDVSKNDYMHAAYKEKKWAFVSDYARLDIVYENGGVYFDNDVEILAPIDTLLFNEAFCGIYSLKGPSFGLGYGSIKGNELLLELRTEYDRVSFYNPDGSLNLEDCLYYQTLVLKRYGYENINKYQMIKGMAIYPTDFFAPMDVYCNPLAYTKNTLSVHHFDASWLDSKDRIQRETNLSEFRKFQMKYPIEETL